MIICKRSIFCLIVSILVSSKLVLARPLNRSHQKLETTKIIYDQVEYNIHYSVNKLKIAQRVEELIGMDFARVHAFFGYRPQTVVHIRINHEAVVANGMAQVFPVNVIELYDYPPLGKQYLHNTSDWLRQLLFHEYVHIVTLDMTHGVADGVRSVFGSWVKPNMILPRWMSEGVATYMESRYLAGGRLNHPSVVYEVAQKLNDPRYCQEIECLDNPSLYKAFLPYSLIAVLTSAHVLAYNSSILAG